MPDVISRADAKAAGLKRYFTGKPRKHGHIAERSVANSTCFQCKRDLDKKHYAQNGDEIRSRVRAYAKANPELIAASHAAYYRENKDKVIAIRDAWRVENPDHVRIKSRQYAATRRARVVGASGIYTNADIETIRRLQKNKCAYCRVRLASYHVDHIKPLSDGGSNWPRNLQLLCETCNLSKGSRDPINHAQRIGMLI